MKIILIAFISFLAFGCSEDVDEMQTPQKKSILIEKKAPAVNPPNAQSLQPDLHISGGEQTHISGAPSSSHISGQ
jgi:PBP1b-binding outer membrane lipoprotein LpoB